jgi:hypothetical protein
VVPWLREWLEGQGARSAGLSVALDGPRGPLAQVAAFSFDRSGSMRSDERVQWVMSALEDDVRCRAQDVGLAGVVMGPLRVCRDRPVVLAGRANGAVCQVRRRR